MKSALLALGFVACAAVASAQTPVNGTTSTMTFTASADQNTVAADGVTPILARYELRFTPTTPGSCAAQPPFNVGKPAPNGSNVITVTPIPALGALPANCIYTGIVAAIGPGGEGVTSPSSPFVRVVPKAPAAAGQPTFAP
jgi:hypothetical protein